MTGSSSISSKPRNKSFDENIEHHNLGAQEVPNICFNQNCRNDGNKWINIIGRYAGYKDHAVPYWVCDECSFYLERRRALFNQLANTLQPYGKLHKTGVDIKNPDPISGNMTITTKDLDELIFGTQVELVEESDQDNEETTRIDIGPPKQKGCYNMYCSKAGTHRIDILNSNTLLKDHEIPYFICDNCYAFFEYRRKDPLVFYDGEVSGISPFTGKEVITTKDLQNLLESTG